MTDREMRKLKRQDLLQMLVALLCTVVDSKGNPMEEGPFLEELSPRLQDAIQSSVRHGDVVAKYGRGQYLVLLVNTTLEDCSIVQERINHQFISGFLKTGVQYYVNSVICFPDKKDMVLGQRK